VIIVVADTVCQVRHIHNRCHRRQQVTLSDNSKRRSMGRTVIAFRCVSMLMCCLINKNNVCRVAQKPTRYVSVGAGGASEVAVTVSSKSICVQLAVCASDTVYMVSFSYILSGSGHCIGNFSGIFAQHSDLRHKNETYY